MDKAVRLKEGSNNIYPCPYYPIGSIYLSVLDINPSTFFGGTWEQIAKGRTLVGVDSSDNDFNTVKKTGGEKKHTLTVDEMPKHRHGYGGDNADLTSACYNYQNIVGGGGLTVVNPSASYARIQGAWMSEKGGSKEHNNLQPYFTCYIWLRIS